MLRLIQRAALPLLLLLAGQALADDAISPADMAALLQKQPAPLVLDVRSASEFADGHLPSARLIPHDELEQRIKELGAPGDIYVYCRSGRRAKLAADVLTQAGFRVHEIEGSYLAWQEAELPIEMPENKDSNQESKQ